MIRFLQSDGGFAEIEDWQPQCWVNVTSPSEEELRDISVRFGIPEDFLEDISDDDERPRVERDDEWVLAIIRIPLYDAGRAAPFFTVPVGIMVKQDYVISVCYHENELTEDFIEHTRRRNIDVNCPADFVLRFLNSSTYWFLRYLKAIDGEMEAEETELQKSIRNEDLLQLMKLQKSLVLFSTSIKGNMLLIERFMKLPEDAVDPDLLDDVDIELKQADTMVSVTTEMLNRTLDTYASVISNNVNAIMKRLTGLSLVMMVPTLVASLYGMNVYIGVSMDNHWAFWAIIGVALALSAIAFVWFRKIKWI